MGKKCSKLVMTPEMKELADKQFTEKWKEHQEKIKEERTAKITSAYGNTYISFGCYDDEVQEMVRKLKLFFELCNIDENDIAFTLDWISGCDLSIKGEDRQRADYIQKFIDNGYNLKWN